MATRARLVGGAGLTALVLAALLAGLVGSFWWAGTRQALGEGFAAVTAQPWGIVTLLDLYLGFAFVAAWIHALERRWPVTLAWAVALCVLGNAATLAYLLLRLRRAGSLAALFVPAAPRQV